MENDSKLDCNLDDADFEKYFVKKLIKKLKNKRLGRIHRTLRHLQRTNLCLILKRIHQKGCTSQFSALSVKAMVTLLLNMPIVEKRAKAKLLICLGMRIQLRTK